MNMPSKTASTPTESTDASFDLVQRADDLFRESTRWLNANTNRLFMWLMIGQWIFGIFLAVVVSPSTWIGDTPYAHMHLWFAMIFGGVVSLPPIVLAIWRPDQPSTCFVIAIAQGVWTCLLIHLTGGRLETHFHAFGSLAFLAFYRDWRILMSATVVISLDHAVRGQLWPLSVYGVAVDSTYRFIEHAAWLAWINVFLLASCFSRRAATRETCTRQAELEFTNAEIELRIQDRTKELQSANDKLGHEYVQREKLHEELLTASRKAGMAEVATGILHNVGNVLNSVNVSARVLSDRIETSPVGKLCKASEIVRENADDLATFVDQDPRGKLLPQMLGQLSEKLVQDRDAQIQEVAALQRSLQHIVEIVQTQQTLASHPHEVVTSFNVIDLIEEAIRIGESSRKRHKVKIARHFGEMPIVKSDKHKLLQILINLLQNASQAAVGQEQPQVDVIAICENDQIKIDVADNGTGIDQENLSRIFNHGFTTKKDGHGFGLHTGALDASRLGGNLSAFSDGPGHGAKFTLTIPVSVSDSKDDSTVAPVDLAAPVVTAPAIGHWG